MENLLLNSNFKKKVKEDIDTYFGFVEGSVLIKNLETQESFDAYVNEIFYELDKDTKQAKVLLLRLNINGYNTDDITVLELQTQIKTIRRKLFKLSVQDQLYEMRKFKQATETERQFVVQTNRDIFIKLEIMKDVIRQSMGVIM